MLNLSNNSGPVFFYLHSVSCHQKYAHTIFHFLSCSRQFSSWFLHKSFMAGLTGVSGTWFSHRPGSPPWRKPMSTQKGERPQADLFKILWLWAFPKKSTFPTEMLSFIENSFSFVLDATKCSAVFANTFVPFLWSAPNHCDLSHLCGIVPITYLRPWAGDGSENRKEFTTECCFLTKVTRVKQTVKAWCSGSTNQIRYIKVKSIYTSSGSFNIIS